jgi:hypothetical protein
LHDHGAFCPGCGREVRSAFDVAVRAGTLQPAPFERRWPLSPWAGSAEGVDAPACPRCDRPVRAAGAPRRSYMGYAQPPWNAGWDGTCDACGHRFALVIDQPLHFHARRGVTVRPADRFLRVFIDEGLALCGVEITVTEQQHGSEPAEQTVFLAMSDVAALAEALRGELAVWLQMYDWSEDWT